MMQISVTNVRARVFVLYRGEARETQISLFIVISRRATNISDVCVKLVYAWVWAEEKS